MTPRHFLAIALLACSSSCIAEKSIYDLTLKELMQVKVVTAASGFEQSLQQAAASATVVTHEEWESMGAYTLADVFNLVAGVHVTKPQVNFNHNIFTIRGMGGQFGEQVKILIDGHPIEYIKDSGPYIGFDMPIDSFKRIEVIKGPGSVVYGADAFAGVINLVSYQVDETPTTMEVRAGGFNTRSLTFSGSQKYKDHQFSLSFEYLKSDDDPNRTVSRDFQTTLDEMFGTQASNAPGSIDEHYESVNLLAKWQWKRVSLSYHSWRDLNFGVGAGIAQALDPQGHGKARNDTLHIKWDLSDLVGFGDMALHTSAIYGKSYAYLNVFPAGTVLPIGSDGNASFAEPLIYTTFTDGYIGTPGSENLIRKINLTHLFDLDSHKIRWEIGYQYTDFSTSEKKNFGPGILDGTQSQVDGELTDVSNTPWVYVSESIRHFYYLSFLDQWQIDDSWLMNLGARFDRYSDFGNTLNPRINLLYRPSDIFTVKLFSGSAFRAPSNGELYYQNNPVSLGNPNLAPEGTNTLEAGLGVDVMPYDDLIISLDMFNYHASDLIRYIYDPDRNGNVAQNVGSENGHGGELSLRWKPSREVTVNFNYSYVSATDADGNDIPDLPRNMYKGSLFWQLDNHWQWSCNARWIKDRRRKVTDDRPKIADYVIFNSRLAYNDLMPGLNLSLSIDNLFDRLATEPSNGRIPEDYPLPGRQWMIQLQQRF